MDQVSTSTDNQLGTPMQQTTQTLSVPLASPKQSRKGYFSRLFSGRTNRRNYFWGSLFLASIPLILLILDMIPAFFIGVSIGFSHPETSGAKFANYMQSNPLGNAIGIVILIVIILWAPFFIINHIAIIIRRLHDLNKSGWMYLLSFIPLANLALAVYLLFFPGTNGTNNYGEAPLSRVNLKEDILRFSERN